MSGLHLVVGLLSLALIVLGSIWFLRMYLRPNGPSIRTSERNQIVKARTKYRSVNGARFSSQIMLFSLAVSMGIALICLSWTRFELPTYTSGVPDMAELKEIDVIRTAHQPARPKPPALPRHIETVAELVATVEAPPEMIETIVEPTVDTGESDSITIAPGPVFKPPLPPTDYVDEIICVVEQMPRFPGCEDMEGSNDDKYACAQEKLLAYIYDQVRYPKPAREAGLEGPVVVRFVVEKDGLISNPEVLRDIGGGCGAEVERVVRSMNTMDQSWSPGKQRGVPVRVQFTLPVYFKLQ